jgi:sulfide:quinone oxidoreductase
MGLPREAGAALEVVVAGGGPGALEAVLGLHELAGPLVRTTLVSPSTELEVRALRTMSEFTGRDLPRPSVRELVTRAGAKLRRTVVRRVLPDEREVLLGDGRRLRYDALVVAVGARAVPAFGAGVITYGLEPEADDLGAALADAAAGFVESIAFVVPPGVSWSLPLYELALMSAHRLRVRGGRDVRLALITPEAEPLALFGAAAAAATRERLERAGIELHTNTYASLAAPGVVTMAPESRTLRVDRVVALPSLEGPAMRGLPADDAGFIPIDEHGAVIGVPDVWAVGDATTFPIKQGGLACQLADAVAEQLAARAGADVVPQPFRPVLRGRLLTGDDAQSMTSSPAGGGGNGEIASRALWAPARKVDGRYLSAHLAAQPGFERRAAHIDVDIPVPATAGGAPLSLDPYSPAPRRR